MSSRNKDERAHVNALVKAMQKNSPFPFYAYIDRDAGSERHTSSGWDAHLSLIGRSVYFEAKEEKKKLSSYQLFTKALIESTGTLYHVVRFWEGGEYFTINDGPSIETKDARLGMFFPGLE